MLVRVRVLKSNILLFFTERFPNHLSWGFEPLLLVAPSAPRVRTDTSNSTAVVLQASSRPRTRAFVYALGLGSHFAICSSKQTAVPMLYIAIYGSQQPGISQGSRALCSGEQYRGVRVVLRVGFSGMTKGWMGYRARWRSSHLSGAMEVNGPSKVPFRLPDKGRGHPCHLSNSSEPPQTHCSTTKILVPKSTHTLTTLPQRTKSLLPHTSSTQQKAHTHTPPHCSKSSLSPSPIDTQFVIVAKDPHQNLIAATPTHTRLSKSVSRRHQRIPEQSNKTCLICSIRREGSSTISRRSSSFCQ